MLHPTWRYHSSMWMNPFWEINPIPYSVMTKKVWIWVRRTSLSFPTSLTMITYGTYGLKMKMKNK